MKKVVKFGGSSLANAEQFKKVGNIIKVDESRVYVVPSAPGKRFKDDIKVTDKQKRKYMVTKSKVRSIHSSLAIEANSLSLFDVENILEHKQIIGKRDEIQEVKNAIEAYDKINNYDYKSEKDFIETHSIMMKYFDEDR